jgi:hypothetical protein
LLWSDSTLILSSTGSNQPKVGCHCLAVSKCQKCAAYHEDAPHCLVKLQFCNQFPCAALSPLQSLHVKWVPYHHRMACPQVADGGEGLQIWRVTANILNKEYWTTDKGWSSRLGVGHGPNNPLTINSNML